MVVCTALTPIVSLASSASASAYPRLGLVTVPPPRPRSASADLCTWVGQSAENGVIAVHHCSTSLRSTSKLVRRIAKHHANWSLHVLGLHENREIHPPFGKYARVCTGDCSLGTQASRFMPGNPPRYARGMPDCDFVMPGRKTGR